MYCLVYGCSERKRQTDGRTEEQRGRERRRRRRRRRRRESKLQHDRQTSKQTDRKTGRRERERERERERDLRSFQQYLVKLCCATQFTSSPASHRVDQSQHRTFQSLAPNALPCSLQAQAVQRRHELVQAPDILHIVGLCVNGGRIKSTSQANKQEDAPGPIFKSPAAITK